METGTKCGISEFLTHYENSTEILAKNANVRDFDERKNQGEGAKRMKEKVKVNKPLVDILASASMLLLLFLGHLLTVVVAIFVDVVVVVVDLFPCSVPFSRCAT